MKQTTCPNKERCTWGYICLRQDYEIADCKINDYFEQHDLEHQIIAGKFIEKILEEGVLRVGR